MGSPDPVHSMGESALGNALLESWLREVRAEVERAGELTEAAIKIPFHGKPNGLTTDLESLRFKLQQNPEGLDATALRERNKTEALAHLDKKLRSRAWWKADCEKKETAEQEARQAAAVLPALPVLDKIMRYETKLERSLYRALAQLERVQRMRRGETLPAPFAVQVSDRE